MTEVACTGHRPRLAGTPRWRVSAASDPVKHVLACGVWFLLTHSFACSFQRVATAGGSSAKSGRCACGRCRGEPDFMASGRWCGVSALLPGIQQREGVLDALLEDLIGELPVG